MRQHGIALRGLDDTMLMSYALDAGVHGHGMDELSELHLGHKPIAFADDLPNAKAMWMPISRTSTLGWSPRRTNRSKAGMPAGA